MLYKFGEKVTLSSVGSTQYVVAREFDVRRVAHAFSREKAELDKYGENTQRREFGKYLVDNGYLEKDERA